MDLQRLLFREFREIVERYGEAVKRCCPHLAPEDLSLRLRFLIGSMAHAMIELPFLDRPGAPEQGQSLGGRETAALLVRFAAAGFRVPAMDPANEPEEAGAMRGIGEVEEEAKGDAE